jgi:dTDP-4-dehydrorhamnose 3,5-epimerase
VYKRQVYKCTAPYNARAEGEIRWDDPEIGIEWPVEEPVLSEKDRNAPPLSEMTEERLPGYTG